MLSFKEILTAIGSIGVHALKDDVDRVTATGKTAASIRFEVEEKDGVSRLRIFARKFFRALETGRGPRRSNTESGFTDGMLEYVRARMGLSGKEAERMANFLRWRINKEGDETFKRGGRVVYSPTLEQIKDEAKQVAKKEFKSFFFSEIKQAFNVR
jgi:hypothetical protein